MLPSWLSNIRCLLPLHLGLYMISIYILLSWVEEADLPQTKNYWRILQIRFCLPEVVLRICWVAVQSALYVARFVDRYPPMALQCWVLCILPAGISFRSLQDLNANTCVLGGRNPFPHKQGIMQNQVLSPRNCRQVFVGPTTKWSGGSTCLFVGSFVQIACSIVMLVDCSPPMLGFPFNNCMPLIIESIECLWSLSW